ncbi:uncharacterized protein [Clytia hemisphaerica]|uniref:uncharacterized protein n=1 Tax=Clytia hemisphaerica TaxID=252671 RepID=UPI0034D6A978
MHPQGNLAIDERLVKSKHRSDIRQYIKNKPVKFGIKLWVINDSKTGYTCDFLVYTAVAIKSFIQTMVFPQSMKGGKVWDVTIDSFVEVERKTKVNDKYCKVTVRQPQCVQRYNPYMNGVDKSDQLLAKFNLLRKCIRWWKILFFHMLARNKTIDSLKRPSSDSLLEYRDAFIKQFTGLPEYANPPSPPQFSKVSNNQ